MQSMGAREQGGETAPIRKRRRLGLPLLTAALGLLAVAPTAQATFHEISIREVYPGSSTNPGAEYVELQMWRGGQNLVGGHFVRTFEASGAEIKANPFGGDVAGGENQSTILIATPAAEAEFKITADGALSPAGQLDPAGGAVCWESLDCVSWGSFSGSLPAAGPPAGAIPDGMALRRTIAPGCPTLLEPNDDRNNSALDFAAVFPAPRPNSVAPSEHACSSTGQNPEGRGAPQTRLRRKPPKKTHDRTPTFRFSSSEAGSTFQCKLDGKKFKACRSPFTAKRLPLGRHTFRVRARDESGKLDPSPASYAFKVIPKRQGASG